MIPIEEMQRIFDKIYSRDQGREYYSACDLTLHPFMKSEYFPGARALDLGCGDGRYAICLASHGFHVTAVDISEVGIAKVQQLAVRAGQKNITCEVKDVLSADIRLQDFDIVVASTILNHLTEPDVRLLAERIARAVESGSSAYISVFTEDDPGDSETANVLQYYFKRGELRSLFHSAGRIAFYEETIEEDASHGPVHSHGIARLGLTSANL